MKRISQDRDLFEANPREVITVTVEAKRVPYQATFSGVGTGKKWTKLQEPTPAQPIEKRTFTMPGSDREFFDIVYAFPPANQADPAEKYLVTISSDITDGPNDVFPPFVGDINDLFYEFRLPQAAPGTAAFIAMKIKSGRGRGRAR